MYKCIGFDLLTAAVGLVFQGAVLPEAFQRFSFDQSVDALQPRPISTAQDEILLWTVAEDVSEPGDPGLFFVADFDSTVSSTPELLSPVDNAARLAGEVALDVADIVGEHIDIRGAQQPMDVIPEPAKGIELDGIELLGSGHDADRDTSVVVGCRQQVPAVNTAGGDFESCTTGVNVTVWSSHTLHKTQSRPPIWWEK